MRTFGSNNGENTRVEALLPIASVYWTDFICLRICFSCDHFMLDNNSFYFCNKILNQTSLVLFENNSNESEFQRCFYGEISMNIAIFFKIEILCQQPNTETNTRFHG